MKKLIALLMLFFVYHSVLAQDKVSTEPVRIDTVQIETVRVDTVLLQPVKAEPVVQTSTVQPEQHEQKPLLNPSKIYFGGYANFSFGNYTAIGIEPMVGYKLTPRFSLGRKKYHTNT